MLGVKCGVHFRWTNKHYWYNVRAQDFLAVLETHWWPLAVFCSWSGCCHFWTFPVSIVNSVFKNVWYLKKKHNYCLKKTSCEIDTCICGVFSLRWRSIVAFGYCLLFCRVAASVTHFPFPMSISFFLIKIIH